MITVGLAEWPVLTLRGATAKERATVADTTTRYPTADDSRMPHRPRAAGATLYRCQVDGVRSLSVALPTLARGVGSRWIGEA